MSYTVTWDIKLVEIPQSDLTFDRLDPVGTPIYLLDLGLFHKEIRRLEWEFTEGFPFVEIIKYVNPIPIDNLLLAPVITIKNGYTFLFEPGLYGVQFENANTDLRNYVIANGVSIMTGNSAGLILPNQPDCVKPEIVVEYDTSLDIIRNNVVDEYDTLLTITIL